jgi:large subunit ribosomal protein L21
MIAVAKIGGHQSIVTIGEVLRVDKLDTEVGGNVSFETLLVSEADGTNFQIGTPFIDGLNVEAKVLEHGKDAKIRVFKMKPRKRYRRTIGHRQDYTVIEITKIGSETKKPAPKKPAVEKTVLKKSEPEKTETTKATTDKKTTKAPAKTVKKVEKAKK